jgi:hypothetical protein
MTSRPTGGPHDEKLWLEIKPELAVHVGIIDIAQHSSLFLGVQTNLNAT